jgi:uncharacterized protein YndB with AHSA1/START domain
VQQIVDVAVTSAAPPEVVWPHLIRADVWKYWGPFTSSRRERPGEPDPDGPGSIRRVRLGPGGSREQNLEVDPPRRLVYTLLSGLPIVDYRAEVTLTPAGSGTRIRWHSTFRPPHRGTGPAMRAVLLVILTVVARALARHICAPPCPLAGTET